MYPLAERLGVTMTLPPVQPRTRRTHEAAHWARSIGRFDEYHRALLAAFFERGENIGDVDVLVALATFAFEQHVIDDEELAKQTDVGSVPAFIASGRYGVIGVQPVDVLRQLVDRAREGVA